MTKYDVIVIGAGPNGLSCAAYLAKAGLKVLVIEKRGEAGGGLCTEEVTFPGFLSNTHSLYHMMVDYAPPYRDFLLEANYNLKYIYPPLQVAMPLQDGQCLCLYSDVQRTCESLARFSRKDAETYKEIQHRFRVYMDEFLGPATYVPPLSVLEQASKMEASEVGREILEYSEKSPRQIVNELFQDEHIRTLMLYLSCHWALDYDVEGVGYLVPLYINRATNMRLATGGSHVVAQGLVKVLMENGGNILTTQRIRRIFFANGKAKGVELEDGTTIEANKAVVSSLDPHQTFLKLVGEDHLTPEFATRLMDWKWDHWSLFSVHLALQEAPNFLASSTNPEFNSAFMYVLGYESQDALIAHWQAIRKGELPAGVGLNCCFPSVHDPSMCRPGNHTGVITQMAPYRLKQGAEAWWKFKKEAEENCLLTLQKYAPNITREKIIWRPYATSPLDIENKFSDMVQGSLKQGQYHPLQMGYLRPNEDCSNCRTSIQGLYICGSSVHPGGLITFGPGYIAANVVAEDLGVKKWWTEPPMLAQARQKGLL